MQKTLEKILKIIIGISFVIPLLVLPKMYIFPFIVPKIVYFRSLVLIMLGIYLVLLLTNFQKYRPKFSWVNIAVLGFYLSFVVSTFVGVDWYKSFWDNHERMLGLFTITHYVVYYFIINSVVRTWEDWKWLLRTFLLAGSVVMFIGLLQKYADPNILLNKGSDRVSSTLGNAIYFSGYGLFLFFIGSLLALKEKIKEKGIELFSMEASWFWVEIVLSLLGLWGIFGGGTRGALVGLIVGFFVLGLVYFFTLKEQKKLKQIVLLSFVGILAIFVVLFINRKTDLVAGIPAVGRLLNTDVSSTNTRVMAWGVALDAWQEKPVWGWGPNNFYYAFNKYYNPQFLEYGFSETWFDNAHSVIMNTLAVQGAVGLVLYLSIFILVTIFLIKKYREGKIDVHILAFTLAFLWAHLISISTVFENPTSYLYFFFFLAFANSFLLKDDTQNMKKNKAVSVPWSIFVFLVILLFVYSTDVNAARANKFTLNALQKVMAGQQSYEEDYKKALSIPSPHVDDIRNDTARVFTDIIAQVLKDSKVNNNWQIIEPLYNQAKDNLEENLKLHPEDIRVSLQLAQLKIYAAVSSQNTQLLEESEAILKGTLELSPKRQQTQYMIAGVQENLHKYDEAVKILRESIDNDPKIANGWQQLESLYNVMGRRDMAKALQEEALNRGIKF